MGVICGHIRHVFMISMPIYYWYMLDIVKKKLRENFWCSIYRIDYYDTLFDLYFNSFCLNNQILQNWSKYWGVKFALGAFNHFGEVYRYAGMF